MVGTKAQEEAKKGKRRVAEEKEGSEGERRASGGTKSDRQSATCSWSGARDSAKGRARVWQRMRGRETEGEFKRSSGKAIGRSR